MIEIHNLSKSYGEIQALQSASIEIQKGEIVGLLGPNGAGKTTLMKLITGVLEPDSGNAVINDFDIVEDRAKAQAIIGYLPENAPLYPDLSVQDYLLMMAELRQIEPEKQIESVRDAVLAVNLDQVITRPIGQLSKGMRQRVGLAQAILHKPQILILDEPTVGLDPTQIVEIRQLIKNLARNSTVLFSTHILSEVEALCDRVIMIMNGKIKADSKLSELANTDNAILILEEDQPETTNLINQLSDVVSVKKEVTSNAHPLYYIQGKPNSDITPKIFKLSVENNWPVRELRKDVHTLESIFNEMAIAE
ncbi:MAG TPA: ATP-binding cassette domain-containing protein [Anaerolineaceae bacterium]|nr:ATP-binding cassette domain-containing protein [Anaerolineaceae bacterium]